MRNMVRNERDMWYAKPIGLVEQTDENGDYTGDPVVKYAAPVYFRAVLSPGRGYTGFGGSVHSTFYGAEIDSERRIITSDLTLGVDETCIIGLGEAETYIEEDVTYTDPSSAMWSVNAKPADGLNFLSISVKMREQDG